VSDDSVGWYCLNQLDLYGIDRTHVKLTKGEFRTSLAVYETRTEQHQSVIYRNNAADFQMTIADVEAVDLHRFGALITTGTVFAAEPSRGAAFRALDLARSAGVTIVFDIDYRPYSWPSGEIAQQVLSRAAGMSDVIVGNDDEFGFMAGDKSLGLTKARDLADGRRLVVYKLGPLGSVTFADGQEIAMGIFPVQAIKPTGAGDSFMAGLMASLADGWPLRPAILRGSACAAIVVAKPGCAPAMPNLLELEAFLASHPGAISV
jgi:5-dehydro-2-deoxygluconokinase